MLKVSNKIKLFLVWRLCFLVLELFSVKEGLVLLISEGFLWIVYWKLVFLSVFCCDICECVMLNKVILEIVVVWG